MSIGRNMGKQHKPVMAGIERFTNAGVVITQNSLQVTVAQKHTFIQLLSGRDWKLLEREPELATDMNGEQRANVMEAPFVICWIPNWKVVSEGLTVMGPKLQDAS